MLHVRLDVLARLNLSSGEARSAFLESASIIRGKNVSSRRTCLSEATSREKRASRSTTHLAAMLQNRSKLVVGDVTHMHLKEAVAESLGQHLKAAQEDSQRKARRI